MPLGVDVRMSPGTEHFEKYTASQGLLVKNSPLLVQNEATRPLGLFAIKEFKKGAVLSGLLGHYRARLPSGDTKRLNFISVSNVPGP